MTKPKMIAIMIVVLIGLIGGLFYISYLFAHKTSQSTMAPVSQVNQPVQPTSKQIRKITFKNIATDETIELFADGTINYYDKNGKLKKTARRGFAETIGKFHDLERLINSNTKIGGFAGYILIIETEQGNIIVNPGDQGAGNEEVKDIYDYVDTTLHPTPRPSPTSTPVLTATPTPRAEASPDSTVEIDPQDKPPFNCADYYKSGKPIKISNIICGSQ